MEKRKSLYDKAIELCLNQNEVAQAVGRTVYYTFNHEQDAMVHQFYGHLVQVQPSTNSFKDQCEESEYGTALDYLYIVNHNKEEAKQYIKQLGLTVESWNKRIHFGYKRFKQKLYNAFLLYSQESSNFNITNEGKTFEINLRGRIMFDKYLREARKCYGNVIFGIESIYENIK